MGTRTGVTRIGRCTRRHQLALSAGAVLAAATVTVVLPQFAPSAAAYTATPVLASRVIGYSVAHRPIVAYHLGDPTLPTSSLILGEMHGDEHAGVTLVNSIIHGSRSIEGINLWVVPTMNPDGNARHTRQNSRGVDLNRNWPDHWVPLSGQYYSGPHPLSEPETRAMHRFLLWLHPHYIVSLHQPLHGVDTTDGGALDHSFRDALAHNLGLPEKPFRCWSFCHGSMTGWYTTHGMGIADTIEFGWQPRRSYLVGRARVGIITALHGHLGRIAVHNPSSHTSVTGRVRSATLTGWVFDIDRRRVSLTFTVYRDGERVATGLADAPSPVLDLRHGLTGRHRFALAARASPGRHRFCVVYRNTGAGSADPRVCTSVVVSAPPPTPSPTPTPSATTSP